MKISVYIDLIKFILLIGFVGIPARLSAGGPENDSILLNSPVYREKFYLFTDRSLYASGEPVMFRIFNLSHPLLKKNNWSTVIYIELINNSNTPVARGKYPLNPEGATGRLIIPDTLTTGSYYIRAYTKWMRNYPSSSYFHFPLTIINPEKTGTTGNITRTATVGITGPAIAPLTGITCTTDKSIYGKREKVTVEIKKGDAHISPDGCFISVTKNGYLDTDYSYTTDNFENDAFVPNEVLYFPETKGQSISGYVVGERDGQAVAYSDLYLTLLGTDPDCFKFKTDERGKILFAIPKHTGSRDVLITVDLKGNEDIRIIMDDEFSREYSEFPVSDINFFLNRPELVEEIMVNSQVIKSFMSATKDTSGSGEARPGKPFYGDPDIRYRTKDYIMLPNLEEFFYELIPTILLKKDQDKRYFTFLGENGEEFYYPPLILLDYVPVTDVESILRVSPQRIEYIDIINTVYIRGNNYYGGIISLVSRDGDRAGVKLPSNSSFFNYSTFYKSEDDVFPDYSKEVYSNRIPDLRTTLYWLPQIDIAPAGGNNIEFYTSDIGGEYIILIQGITMDGKIVRGVCEFSVK